VKKCENTSEITTTVQDLLGAFESESEFCWLINHQLAEGAASYSFAAAMKRRKLDRALCHPDNCANYLCQ